MVNQSSTMLYISPELAWKLVEYFESYRIFSLTANFMHSHLALRYSEKQKRFKVNLLGEIHVYVLILNAIYSRLLAFFFQWKKNKKTNGSYFDNNFQILMGNVILFKLSLK